MTTDGGAGEKPTSYELRPPVPSPRAGAAVSGPVGGGVDPRVAGSLGAETGPPEESGPSADSGVSVDGGVSAGAGRLIGGRYRLLERLGSGGMGTVWRAHDETVDRDVAVKEPRLPDDLTAAQRRTAHQRMEREARAAARIDHPGVVTIHDVVTERDRPWIVMELLRGRSLAETLDEGTLQPHETARIAHAVLSALHTAHEAGVLHRDVKPANIMLCRHQRVVLTDFGIAHIEGEQQLTETGAFIGSPEYLAPERVLGRRPGPESDLWSLGITLYQALEGTSPFRRHTTPTTLQAILLAQLPPPQHTHQLTPLVTGLLHKEPENRLTTQTAQALLHTLTPPSAEPARTPTLATAALPAAPPALSPAGFVRGRRGVATAAVAALALIAALVFRFTGDDVPEGWKRYDEYRMRLSVAAPADWAITVEDRLDGDNGAYRATRYTAPKKDVWLLADRKEKTTETPRAIAERWKSEHESASPPSGGAPSSATVESTTHQGRDAAVITETYSQQAEGAPRRHCTTLIVVTSRQERLTLGIDVPADKNSAKTLSDLLATARSAFEIRDL